MIWPFKPKVDPEQEAWDREYPSLKGANAEERKNWRDLWAEEASDKQWRQDCHDAGQQVPTTPGWIYKGTV